MQHKKEGYEVDGDQHQRKDSHQIAVRLNLKRVARRRSQETEPKRISKIEKTKHVPRRNKTCGLLRRSRISKTHNGCQEAYDGVAQASGQGKEAGQRPGCREENKKPRPPHDDFGHSSCHRGEWLMPLIIGAHSTDAGSTRRRGRAPSPRSLLRL